jgi:hypothetical protein
VAFPRNRRGMVRRQELIRKNGETTDHFATDL